MRYFNYDSRLYAEKTEAEGTAATEETEEAAEETSEETTEAEGETEETPSDDELGEDELKEAKSLFKLLKDPHSRDLVIRGLAEKAGVLRTESPSKTQEKKDLKSILSIFEEELGDQFKFLAPNFSKAVEKVLEQERESQTEKFNQIQVDRLVSQVDAAKDKLSRETKGESKKFEKQMEALADKYHPAEGVSVYDYVKTLYTLASADGQKSNIKREVNDKIIRNSKDVGSRLQSQSTSSGKSKESTPKTLKGIVEAEYQKLLKG